MKLQVLQKIRYIVYSCFELGEYRDLLNVVVWWFLLLHNFHQRKAELRFCEGSNPARGLSEIRDGENL